MSYSANGVLGSLFSKNNVLRNKPNCDTHTDIVAEDLQTKTKGSTKTVQSTENMQNIGPYDDLLCAEETFPPIEPKTHKKIRDSYGDSIENIRIMYPMEKVYSDVGEFQLEEIIAAKWRRRALENCPKNTHAIQSQEKTDTTSFSTNVIPRQDKENVVPQTDESLIEEQEGYKTLKKAKEKAEEKLLVRQNQLSQVLEVLNAKLGINVKENSDELTLNMRNVYAQLMNLDMKKVSQSSKLDTESTSVWEVSDSIKDKSSLQNFPTATNNGSASFCSSHLSSEPRSSSTLKLSHPSPTLFTKEALGSIEDMFNKSLKTEPISNTNAYLFDRNKNSQLSLLFDEPENLSNRSAVAHNKMQNFKENDSKPFQIFCDEPFKPDIDNVNSANLSNKNLSQAKSSGFQIFCDEPSKPEIENVHSACLNDQNVSKSELLGFPIFCDESSSKQNSKTQILNKHDPPAFSIFCDEPSQLKSTSGPIPSDKLAKTNSYNFKMFEKKQFSSNSNFGSFLDGFNDESFASHSVIPRKCNSSKIYEMSETIVSDGRNFSDITLPEREGDLESGILAESTSYKQLLSKKDVINNEIKENSIQNDGTKKSKKLSPILETDYEGDRTNQAGSESLYPNKCLTNANSEVTDFPSLSSIGSALKHSVPSLSQVHASRISEQAEKSCTVEKASDFLSDSAIQPNSEFVARASSYSVDFSKDVAFQLNMVFDPWSEAVQRPIILMSQSKRILRFTRKSAVLRKNSAVRLANLSFAVLDVIGQGGFAKVYHVLTENRQPCAIKVEFPPCEWEIVIMELVKERLKASHHPLVSRLLIDIQYAVIFTDASWLVSEFVPYGSLLDFVNNTSKTIKISPLQYHQLALQILSLVDALHSVDIIHGDIKPDNFLVYSDYKSSSSLKVVPQLRLIDFGRSIDMKSFPPNTFFTQTCGTSAFVCTQMKLNLPWNYHTDFYGTAGTVFLLLTNSYMKVMQQPDYLWKPTNKLPRWASALWSDLLSALLNYPSPSEEKSRAFQTSPLPEFISKFKNAIEQLKT